MDSNNVKKPDIYIMESRGEKLKIKRIGYQGSIGNGYDGKTRTGGYTNYLSYCVTEDLFQKGKKIFINISSPLLNGSGIFDIENQGLIAMNIIDADKCKEPFVHKDEIFNEKGQKEFVMNLIGNGIDLYIEPIWSIFNQPLLNLIKDQEIAEKVNFKIMTKDGKIYDLDLDKLKEENDNIRYYTGKLINYAIDPNLAMNHGSNEELYRALKK